MAALNAAKLLSFDSIEQIYHHLKPASRIPDDILKPILKRCFPRCPEDIRTYSFIANGSPAQFNDGMQLYENGAVQSVVQIGKNFLEHFGFVVIGFPTCNFSKHTYKDCR
jgi:hypothetical protein